MPLGPYVWLHAEADLTSDERERLARGLAAVVESAPKRADD
jgi:hypothetical protein